MKPRRWFRFGLSTLFVLVTLAACAARWVQVQMKWIHDRHAVLGGDGSDRGGFGDPAKAPDAPWPLRWFGETGCYGIAVPQGTSKEEMERVKRLFPEAKVEFF